MAVWLRGRTWTRRWRYWLTPGMGVKRHVAAAVVGAILALIGTLWMALWWLHQRRFEPAVLLERAFGTEVAFGVGWLVGGTLLLLGLMVMVVAVGRLNRSLLSNWVGRPQDLAEAMHRRLLLARGPRIVAVGGGTGLSLLLRGLRRHTSNLTAVVAVSDDGGSSGRLRSAFGMPAPGDLSDCLAALSADEASLGRLLEYRFARGRELEGHTFGNLLITTLSEMEGDFGEALRVMQRLLDLRGSVWPATAKAVTLRVEKVSGVVVEGESQVVREPGAARSVSLDPPFPTALPEVVAAIRSAEMVLLGPGSLFTSTLPPLLVPAVAEAVRHSRARLVQIVNIMTEAGETDGFSAWDHIDAVERHLGRRPDVVVVNTLSVDPVRLAAYRLERADLVEIDAQRFAAARIELLAWPLLGPAPHAQHDAATLADGLVTWWGARA
jgi:uncharacterized cofD-like protein